MGHAGDRQLQPVPPPDPARVGPARVHHVLAHVVALLGDHAPLAVRLGTDSGDAVAAHDLRAALAGAGGERERGAGGVDVTVLRRPQRRLDAVEVVEGVEPADGVRAHDLHRVPERGADARGVAQPVELVVGVGDAERAAVVEGDRLAGLRLDAPVELDGVARHAPEPVARRGVRDLAGRVPGRAGGELSLLQQYAVRPAFADEVVGEGASEDAPADDHDARVGGQTRTPNTDDATGGSASTSAGSRQFRFAGKRCEDAVFTARISPRNFSRRNRRTRITLRAFRASCAREVRGHEHESGTRPRRRALHRSGPVRARAGTHLPSHLAVRGARLATGASRGTTSRWTCTGGACSA